MSKTQIASKPLFPLRKENNLHMARKKQSENNMDVLELAQSIGLTAMTDATGVEVSEWLPTEIPHLDRILGGGLPFGRVVEIYGMNSSGKSTLAALFTKQAQKFKVPPIWVDVEGTTTRHNMEQLGVDPDSIIHYKPEIGEVITIEKVAYKIKEMVEAFSQLNVPILVIWDSVASTPAEAEIQKDYNQNRIGTQASAITHMTKVLGTSINQTNISFVIINQARDDLNAGAFMGPQQKSTGGHALKHWASLRLEVKKGKQVKEKVVDPVTGKEEERYIGHIFRVITEKSKVSTPNQRAEMYLISEPYKGIDPLENLYRLSVATQESKNQYGLITGGAWRSYITDSGEEIKLRHNEWVPFLQSEEGQAVAEELYFKQITRNFPDWYVPLDNEQATLLENPFYKKLKDYYENKGKTQEEPTTESEETEEE